MQTEELKDLVGKLFIANVKEGVNHLVLGCFYDLGCDIRRCKSEDYNLEKGTGTCCRYYETKCKETIKAFENMLENGTKIINHKRFYQVP